MKVHLKTAGLVTDYLAEGSHHRGKAEVEAGKGATVISIMAQLGIPEEGQYLVSLNGELVHAQNRGSAEVFDGDLLAILPPLKGG